MPLCDSCIFSRIPCPVRDFDIMIDIEVCAYWKDREALVDAVAACLEERILSPTRETCGKCMHRGETAFDEGAYLCSQVSLPVRTNQGCVMAPSRFKARGRGQHG